MFDNIGRYMMDFFQSVIWFICETLMMLINTLLDSLINGVLNLDIFANNSFLSNAFKCSLALMFLIIPVKIIYEVISSMIKDDDAGMDIQKKIGSTFMGIVIACSLTFAVTNLINPFVTSLTKVIININLVNTNNNQSNQNYQIGDQLIEAALVSFGGIPENGNYGAKELIKQYNAGNLDINERYDEDTSTHKKYDYKWNINVLLSLIGLAIYVIMLFMIVIQVSVRIISIGFYYIIGPLCCTSMTNYQNPQAFIVWKNTLIGQWLQNVSQILLLALMVALLNSISLATQTLPIARCALYFGALTLIISAPSFVQAMVGGYASGVMDMMNSFRGGFGMAKSSVVGTIGAVMGRKNSNTGHLSGGLRGAMMGDKNMNDVRRGGVRGLAIGNINKDTGFHKGGMRGLIAGNKDKNGQFKGGLRGLFNGNGTSNGLHAGGGNENLQEQQQSYSQGNVNNDGQPSYDSNGRTMDTSNIGNAADSRQNSDTTSSALGRNMNTGFNNTQDSSNKSNTKNEINSTNASKFGNTSSSSTNSSKKDTNIGWHDRGQNTTNNKRTINIKDRSFKNPFLK